MMNQFLQDVAKEVARARDLFPSNRHQLAAFAEEAGEVANAFLDVDYGKKKPSDVYTECVQAAAMACRLATEGDESFTYKPEVRS